MKITKILTLAMALTAIFQSCDLNREPADYIPYEKSFQTLDDARKWDNGIYSSLRGKFGGGYVLPQEAQADMLNAHASNVSSYVDFHGWTLREDDDVLKQIYHSYYAALVDANVVIDRLPSLELTDAEKTTANQFLGDAYFARAFYHFNLALRWGQLYNEETADKDLGIPLALTPIFIEKPERATNRVTYDQVLSDLDKADSLLANVPVQVGNTEISADAVKALRARVYLYMGKMEDALKVSSELIGKNTYPLVPAYVGQPDQMLRVDPRQDAFAQMWFYDNGAEQIWQPIVAKENEIPTTTNLYGADLATATHWDDSGMSDMVSDYNKPPYLPTNEVLTSLFANDQDHRAQVLFEYTRTTVSDMQDYTYCFVISKFKGNPNYATLTSSHWGGYVPNGNQAPKPFRIAEQYLIAAEAAYATGNQDKARFYLNELRISRGTGMTGAADDALLKEIKDERARELAYEGFRLWDLRRWHEGFNKRSHQVDGSRNPIDSRFYAIEFSENFTIEADNPKFVWPFPKDELTINKGIKQNPGWEI